MGANAADGEVTYVIRADDSNLDGDLDAAQKKVEKSVDDGTSKLQERSGKMALAVGAGVTAVGGAVIGIGKAAVSSAIDMDSAINGFLASTGKGAEEAERYQGVLEGIYANNYGESFEDIASAMADADRQLGDMSDEQLQQVTESAFALRDVFEYDISESTRAAKAMMDNFGISGDEAMGLIAAGAQNGLDYSGELIDSINEYSVQFAKVGMDADDMFQIFQQGAESGAWNLDKIGDAVKEFSIRAIDGSKTTLEGFELIGLNADEMSAKFAAGGDSAKTAFQETIQALAAMEDPLEQNIAGTDLFGTMWEDLGPEAVAALAGIKDGAYDTADAMEGIKDIKYDDLGSMLEGLKRNLELLLIPLGEELMPILSELVEVALPLIQEAVAPILDVIGELIGAVLPVLSELIGALLPIFAALVEILAPVVNLFAQLLEPVITLIDSALKPLVSALTPIVEVITGLLAPALELLGDTVGTIFSSIAETVGSVVGNITGILQGLVDFVVGVFTGNWGQAWEGIKSIFGNAFEAIGSMWKAPINAIIDGINRFLKGLNGIQIPDWVPVVGGKGFNIPTIPRLRIGMDYVPADDFPALLHRGEAVLTAEDNRKLRAAGGLERLTSSLSEEAQLMVQAGEGNNPGEIDYERLAGTTVKAFQAAGAFEHGDIVLQNYQDGNLVDEQIFDAEAVRNLRSGGRE